MSKKPKVVVFDIETLPNPRLVMERLPSIGNWPGRTLKGELSSILTFGYKINDQKAKTINAWEFPNWEFDRWDDSIMCEAITEILIDADEIAGHNSKRFDIKVIETRMKKHKMPRLPKISHVDTLTAAKNLSLYSNRLDDVAKFLDVDGKLKNGGWPLWVKFMFGEDKAKDRKMMSDYCKQDVEATAQVYKELRPWHGNHSAHKSAIMGSEEKACRICLSESLKSYGLRHKNGQACQRLQCNDCGTWSYRAKKGKIKLL